ncbi:hypothetical protein [Gimesia chilikensis]|uniref:hypothetical protein n=1 Tax=Gimesia chilikensis TaxID=2605989 RepID=UPI0011A00BE7|nr:hypothetical protein [Gimesia chilikensis]
MRNILRQLLRSTLILSLALVACCPDLFAQPTAKFAPVKPAGDPATCGANIQRTMTLLATSTA